MAIKKQYFKIEFNENGVKDIEGKNITVANHIEAMLALLISLHEEDPELGSIRAVLKGIDCQRKALISKTNMISHLEQLRDVLQKAREKAENEVKKAQKKTNKKK